MLVGAYLFGAVTILQLHAAGASASAFPSQFLSSLPYLATIVVLVVISRNARADADQHAGLSGQAFVPDR